MEIPALGDVGPELLVDGVGERHVLEHPLQLAGELTTTLGLQLADHHLLRVV